MPSKVCNGIMYPFPNFNSYIVEVLERVNNFSLQFIMDVITYPCKELIHICEEAPERHLNIKMSSNQYRDHQFKDKTVSHPSYL